MLHDVNGHRNLPRSGDAALEQTNRLARTVIKAIASVGARSVDRAIAPVHDFIDSPPDAPLTAVDRHKPVPLDLKTLDPAAAQRLAEATAHYSAPLRLEDDGG